MVTSVRNVERLLARADPNVHHGQGMTCVWTKETAACRKTKLAAGLPDLDAPDDTECRSTCVNLAYTDRDIEQLTDRLPVLDAHAGDPLAPQPLRDRAAAQAAAVRTVIGQPNNPDVPTPHDRSDDGPPSTRPGRRVNLDPVGDRSTSGRHAAALDVRAESGLSRDVVYAHPDLVEEFHAALAAALAVTKRHLADERATTVILRKALAELSLELQQAKDELAELGAVTVLRAGRPGHGGPRRG